MKKNVKFVRVSSDKQDFLSQSEGLDKYISDNKVVIHEVIEEYAVSGFKTPLEKRKGLMKIKDMALKGEIENLYVYSSDRIGRRLELISFMSVLTECDVRVISVTEGILNNKDSDIDELLNCIRFFNSQTESKKLSGRVINGKLAKAKEGIYQSSVTPFGYNRINKSLAINEQEAQIIKLAFELYINYGTSRACEELNNKGYTKRGSKWTYNTMKTLFRNRLFIGEYWYKEQLVYKDESLRILDDITFYNANTVRKQRNTEKGTLSKGANKSPALLEGLLYKKCIDGNIRKLTVSYSNYNNKDGTRYLVYRSQWDKFEKTKDKNSYSGKKYEPIIEHEIIKAIKNMINIDKLKEEELKRKSSTLKECELKINDIRATLEQKNKALNNANDQLEKIFAGESTVSVEMIDGLIKKLNNDISELNKTLIELEQKEKDIKVTNANAEMLVSQFKLVDDIYLDSTIEDKKAILNKFIDKIVIEANDEINIHFNI